MAPDDRPLSRYAWQIGIVSLVVWSALCLVWADLGTHGAPSEKAIQLCLADGIHVTRRECREALRPPLVRRSWFVTAAWGAVFASLALLVAFTAPGRVRIRRRVRLAFGVVGAALLVVAVVVDYKLVKSCSDSQFRDAWYVEAYVAPVLAVSAVAGLRFRPTWLWITALALSPIAGWVLVFGAGLQGEFAGLCGRF